MPLPESVRGEASLEHLRVQLDAPLQLTEQELVQTTAHEAPAPHETLELRPIVSTQLACSQEKLPLSVAATVQVLPPLHSPLHEPAQVPRHWLASRHLSEQLCAPAPQLVAPAKLQDFPAPQTHSDPVHGQAGPGHAERLSPPQAPRAMPSNKKSNSLK